MELNQDCTRSMLKRCLLWVLKRVTIEVDYGELFYKECDCIFCQTKICNICTCPVFTRAGVSLYIASIAAEYFLCTTWRRIFIVGPAKKYTISSQLIKVAVCMFSFRPFGIEKSTSWLLLSLSSKSVWLLNKAVVGYLLVRVQTSNS